MSARAGSAGEVFRAFLALGLVAFGGPIAHVGYLREAFVRRRGWLDEAQFAQLLAVCQFLPGPASSQMGFAIGLFRAGWRGALAAFVGFTLPSALLMLGFAMALPSLGQGAGASALHGLKLVAVVVVAHGLVGMARQLVPDLRRAAIALACLALVMFAGSAWSQVAAIALGALAGAGWGPRLPPPTEALFPVRHGYRAAVVLAGLFAVGLLLAMLAPPGAVPSVATLAAACYRAGALVFGGGHVVLPLLEQALVRPGWLQADAFLVGYGAAQAVPGPMFSLAAYLGAALPLGVAPVVGGLVALIALFLPGFLLLAAVLPLWTRLVRHPRAARAIAGANAAVVALLAAAFVDPVLREGVRSPLDAGIAVVGYVLLAQVRVPAWGIVVWCVAAAVLAGLR